MPARTGGVRSTEDASGTIAEEREQLSAKLPATLMRRLRLAKIDTRRDIADIVAEAVASWLDHYEAGG